MVVQHNLTALNSNRMLGITTNTQAKSTEKLSSGYKINRAADDAAGLSISEKMRKQIRGLTQASSNAQDGISAVQTAEGALNEVQDMLQRMNELAVKAANGTMSEDDRSYIQDEIDQLVTEIDRVSETTKFNETYMLKGGNDSGDTSYSYITTDAGIAAKDGGKIYAADGSVVTSFTEDSITDAVASNNYFSAIEGTGAQASNVDLVNVGYVKIESGAIKYETGKVLYKTDGEAIDEADLATYLGITNTTEVAAVTDDTVYTGIQGTTAAIAGDFKEVSASTAKLYDKDGKEIAEDSLKDYVDEDGNYKLTDLYTATDGTTTLTAASVDEYIKSEQKTGILKFTLQVGADTTDDNKISVEIESMGAENLGVDGLKVDGKDSTNADAAVGVIEKAIQKVSTQRSALGAVQNRLEHTINNLDNVVENTTSAESAIRDTDMATEMVKYSNNNILAQAGQAMLAQANQSNQGVLSLLG